MSKLQPIIGSGAKPIDKEEKMKEKNTIIQHVPKDNLKPKIPEYGKPIPKNRPEIDEASKAKLSKFVSFNFT
tara:strand:- start:480 stop:695 length:216 start_codon:yes stop_codon:yes gene_type:complete